MTMNASPEPAVWFPAVRAGSGTDVFTIRLAAELRARGLRTEITWLPLRAEYAPWSVSRPKPPAWANIVHINSWLHPRFLPDGLPVIATLHHSMHHPEVEIYKSRARALYHKYWIKPAERRTLQRAHHVVAVSRFAADTSRENVLDRSIQVIQTGVDTMHFRPPDRRDVHEPFRLLYVGKWSPLKGVGMLAPIMRELGQGFELQYTGGANAQKDRPGMPSNMRDIGRLGGSDAVIAAMQDADAFLFPSRSEGLPLSVLEAMACGLPVVAARGSSLGEVVDDGVTGILCDKDSASEFAGAVQRLAGHPMVRNRMGDESRRRAVAGHSLENMVTDWVDCYQSVILQHAEDATQK